MIMYLTRTIDTESYYSYERDNIARDTQQQQYNEGSNITAETYISTMWKYII